MNSELLTILSQFGPAGLMGLLWILERRHAALRERQLTEAHRAVAARDHESTALLDVVRDNTRAIATLEHTQRQVLRTAERLSERLAMMIRAGDARAPARASAASHQADVA